MYDYGPVFPDWGADQPPERHYGKEYVTGPQGDMHAGEVLCEVAGTKVLRCHPCRGIHLWPLSTPEALAAYYAERFYQEVKPAYLAEYAEDEAWWHMTHSQILLTATQLLPPTAGTPRLLEVGAGPGQALAVGQAMGWDTHAIEPSPVAALDLVMAGHTTFQGTLTEYRTLHGQCHPFEALYLYETLEHQPNPEEFLLQCHALLAPGGVLVVVVPNDFSPAQLEACARFMLPRWWVSVPDHQFYYSPKTLQLLVRQCGFTQRYLRMTYPLIETFMLERGLNYVTSPALGRGCHRERMRQELEAVARGYWPQTEARYIANVEARVGREIVGIWTKEG